MRFARPLLLLCAIALVAADDVMPPIQVPMPPGTNSHELGYLHTAWDYRLTSPIGCESCGGGTGSGGIGAMPRLELRRIHRYLDVDAPSSFGPGVFLSYDYSLDCAPLPDGRTIVTLFDPTQHGLTVFSDADGDGTFRDGIRDSVRWLRFYDASGSAVPALGQATSAAVLTHTGTIYHFDLFQDGDPGAPERVGRLRALEDRNGHAISLRYEHAADADSASLGFDRSRLWRLATIVDAYGAAANVTYAAQPRAGRWVVEAIALPNGENISYEYGAVAQDLVSLARVRHPDGSLTTIAIDEHPATQTTTVAYDDPAADAGQQRLTAHYTRVGFRDPATGVFIAQRFGRIRAITNAQGEVVYENRSHRETASGGVVMTNYVGRATLRYTNAAGHGNPTSTEVVLADGTARLIVSYPEHDAFGRPLAMIDGLGRRTGYERDPRHGAITRTSFPDGTFETTTYDEFRQPLEIRDRRGVITRYEYGAHGDLRFKRMAEGTPDESASEWRYDEAGANAQAGQPTSYVDGNGNVTSYRYDQRGRLIAIVEAKDDDTDRAHPTRSFGYDDAGRLAWSRDQSQRSEGFAYDGRNRVAESRYDDGSFSAYGYANGLPLWSRDRNGHVALLRHDLSGRLIERLAGLSLRDGRAPGGDPADYDGIADAARTRWTYFAGTELVTAIEENGERTTIAYDDYRREATRSRRSHRLEQVEATVYDAAGRIDHRVRRIGAGEQNQWRTIFVYDALDRVVRTIRDIAPDGAGDLSTLDRGGIVRDLGPHARYAIDDEVHVVPGTRAYDPDPLIAARIRFARISIDPRGNEILRGYDHRGRIAESIEAFGTAIAAKTVFIHDAEDNLVRVLRPRHFSEPGPFVTDATFGGRNRLRTVTRARGSVCAATTLVTYTPTGKPATVTEALGTADEATVEYRYGECCDRVVAVIDGERYVTGYRYDLVGNLVATIDPLTNATSFTYDARDRLTTRTNAAGETWRFTYDDGADDAVGLSGTWAPDLADLGFGDGHDGGLVQIEDPARKRSLRVVDGVDRVVRTVDANGHRTSVAFDIPTGDAARGWNLVAVSVTDANGHTTGRRYDGLGREVARSAANGHLWRTDRDPAGNIVRTRDPNGVGHDAEFDPRDRLLTSRSTGGRQIDFAYDLHGNVIAERDGYQRAIAHRYDARDRRTTTVDRIAGTTLSVYDLRDRLRLIRDAEGGETVCDYDDRDLLTTQTLPGPTGGTRTFIRDAARRLHQRHDPDGNVTTFAYDDVDRLVSRTSSRDGFADVYDYDRVGRLVSAESGRYRNRVERGFDDAGRLTWERQVIAGVSHEIGYGYDEGDRLTGITHPDGTQVERRYAPTGALIRVLLDGADVVERGYDDGLRPTSTRFANGLVETRAYRSSGVDRDDLVATIATAGVSDLSYGYNREDSLRTVTDGITPSASLTLGFDREQRLVGWTRSDGVAQRWELSPVGDWRSTQRDGVTETRTHSPAHDIDSVTIAGATIALGRDAKGNLTRDRSGAEYAWDVEDHLVSATATDADEGVTGVVAYEYDAFGRRVRRHAWGMTTTWLYDGQRVIHESEAPQALEASAADDDGTGEGDPPGGALLADALVRVNFQPAARAIPAGFVADKGRAFGERTNGHRYGWEASRLDHAIARGEHPYPQYDTLAALQPADVDPGVWEFALPNGSYPIVLVMGDCASTERTNHVEIEGARSVDPDPAHVPSYERGDFDAHIATAVVADGRLTIRVGDDAVAASLCFIEIGRAGTTLDDEAEQRIATAVAAATRRTGGARFPESRARSRTYVYGGYVDEPVMIVADGVRYCCHADRSFSVVALTDASGAVVERYRYSAHGERTVFASDGTVIGRRSTIGNPIGFTGREHDADTGLIYFRARWLSPIDGVFISRDPIGYVDGMSLSRAYFAPNGVDPSGLFNGWGVFWGSLQMLGGAGEMAAGSAVFAAGVGTAAPTAGGGLILAAGGVVMTAHGADNFIAGFRSAWSAAFDDGPPAETMTYAAVLALSGDPSLARSVDVGLSLASIAGSLRSLPRFMTAAERLHWEAALGAKAMRDLMRSGRVVICAEQAALRAMSPYSSHAVPYTTSLYTVQGEANAARLLGGGAPWPTAPTQAHLGPGLYAWGTRTEAEAYMAMLQSRAGYTGLRIMEASAPTGVFQSGAVHLGTMSDDAGNAWLAQHSLLHNEAAVPYVQGVITRPVNTGTEVFVPEWFFQFFEVR